MIWSSEEKDCSRFYFVGHTHAQHWLKSDANAFFVETFFMSPCFVLAITRQIVFEELQKGTNLPLYKEEMKLLFSS